MTKAMAINPSDFAMQQMGIIIDAYPAILGCDVAGVVKEIGASIADSKVGDRVMGQAAPVPGGISKHSGFQQYVVLQMPCIANSRRCQLDRRYSAAPSHQHGRLVPFSGGPSRARDAA